MVYFVYNILEFSFDLSWYFIWLLMIFSDLFMILFSLSFSDLFFELIWSVLWSVLWSFLYLGARASQPPSNPSSNSVIKSEIMVSFTMPVFVLPVALLIGMVLMKLWHVGWICLFIFCNFILISLHIEAFLFSYSIHFSIVASS